MLTHGSCGKDQAGGGEDRTEQIGRSARAKTEVKRKHHSLIDKVYWPRNLAEAWRKVRDNRGCAGVDRQTVAQFDRNAERYLRAIHAQLREGRYDPQAIRRVWIPKPDGRQRPLGIPTVADRVVQQAVLNVLGPIFERKFLDLSHGFRPGRSTHTALRQVWKHIKTGFRTWVVDADIKAYFDSIPHERLLDFVAEEVADGKVLALVRQFLTAPVRDGEVLTGVEKGTPQGGVVSPLLANIYLHYFDERLSAEGFKVVRYADDFVVLGRTRQEAERAFARIHEILEGELGLTVHPTKTRIVHVSQGFDFLGYTIQWTYRLHARPTAKAIERFREKVRRLTRRCRPVRLVELLRQLNALLRGWGTYYRKAQVRTLFWKLDAWILWRIRSFIGKRWRSTACEEYPARVLHARYGLVRLWTLAGGVARPR